MSGTELAREVEKRGLRTPRGNRIDKKFLYRMLNNRACIGEAVHKGQSYPGEHDAIIDRLRAVIRQPEVVAGTWKAAKGKDGGNTEAEARKALQQLDPLWDELFPAEQARIVALLIERIDIGTEGLDIRLRVDGLRCLPREMMTGDMGAAA